MVIAATLNDTVFAWIADGTGAGSLLWSRQGAGTNSYGGNALWYDDCGGSTGAPVPRIDVLQFEGILSTPVIDASGSTPVMFLTSYCVTIGGLDKWFLHEINLQTGTDYATKHHIGGSGDFASITEGIQQQRPALLQVKNSGNSTTPNLIYILFGTGTKENLYGQDYMGWVVAYENTSGGLLPEFAYSDEPTGCGTGGGLNGHGHNNGQCTTGNSGIPSCDCYLGADANTPNWGGHGGGCWMSGNGPSATTVGAVNSDNAVHVFFGCGNGGFQAFNGTTPDASNNNGETVMDFRLESGGYDSTAAYQTFTPKSPAGGVAPPLPGNGVCGCTSSNLPNCTACTTTLQTLNANDYDMSTGGVPLFNDLSETLRLATADKAGYGYLLTPGSLCGSSYTNTPCVGFQSTDPGSWTFGASSTLCAGGSDSCDRVTDLTVYDNYATQASGGSGRAVYLNYWPYNERLTSLEVSDNATPQGGTGQLTSDPSVSPKTMALNSSCTAGENCLSDQVVAGDTLTLPSCSCLAGSSCPPVITSVTTNSATDSEINLNITVASAFGSCSYPKSFQYAGYLVTPAHDTTPTVAEAGYPGAALSISAECSSTANVPCTNALIWAVVPGSGSEPDSQDRGLGTVYAYTALPNMDDHLHMDWNSTDTWCASSFARPAIVYAGVFVPTYLYISSSSGAATSCPTSPQISGPYQSGLLVYR
jgi:hypothetical protein